MQSIINAVCSRYEVDPSGIYNRTRKRAISEPRQVILTLLHSLLKMTLSECTKPFGMNYTTVCTTRKTIQNLYETDKIFRSRFDMILVDLKVREGEKKIVLKLLKPSTLKRKKKTGIRQKQINKVLSLKNQYYEKSYQRRCIYANTWRSNRTAN